MRLLLDTHIFLWLISGDSRLSVPLRAILQDPQHQVFLSVVSFWEIVIKHQLGKLPLPESPEVFVPTQRRLHQIGSLPVDEASVAHLDGLPLLHRDPFDRMLICQTIEHSLTLVTVDTAVRAYPVTTLSIP